jgi:hypothetical protein
VLDMTSRSARIAVPALVVALAAVAAGCSGGTRSGDATTGATTTTAMPQVSHAAPDLEALLPVRVAGTTLERASTTGAAVFGGDAFSREMTQFLAATGREPGDLRFANARDPNGRLELEVGVFEVKGMSAATLRRGIVAASRPNAPGLKVSGGALGGKPVTVVVYPAGTVLYLYEQGDRVFYVGTQSEALARRVIDTLP